MDFLEGVSCRMTVLGQVGEDRAWHTLKRIQPLQGCKLWLETEKMLKANGFNDIKEGCLLLVLGGETMQEHKGQRFLSSELKHCIEVPPSSLELLVQRNQYCGMPRPYNLARDCFKCTLLLKRDFAAAGMLSATVSAWLGR